MASSRSTRRKSGSLTRNDAEDTTTMTNESPTDPPAYEPIEGGDTDRHRHDGTLTHAHADPPHWHDGNEVVPFHDPPVVDEAALYGPDPNPDNPSLLYEPPRLDGPHPLDVSEAARSDATVPSEQVDSSPLSTDVPRVDGVAAGRAVAEQERYINGNGIPTDPKERARLEDDLRRSLALLTDTTPAPEPPPTPEPPPAQASRLGAILASLEMIKASYKGMLASHGISVPDEVAQEYALATGATDILGQMFDYYGHGTAADPGLLADLRTIAEQIDQAAAARTRT